ncbi:major facilitator superfamily domain-containing protein [Xylariomycetidae sp. FL2044]|nr:major facilitator superfamily domain-containing protein [Xylariomycetidae sp. FL2044]
MANLQHRTDNALLESNPETNPIQDPVASDPASALENANRGLAFWMIMVSLILAAIIGTLDGGVVTTSLPTIVRELDLGPEYIWVTNIYFLTSAAFQPLFGQLSDLWGRRWVFISTVAIFLLGSGLCGGASTGSMLIAGRGVQGVGSGGISVMVELIICDLVPLRERGKYIGMVLGGATTISGLSPLFGGALTEVGAWRWIWYLNLPLGGVSIVIALIWLRVSHRQEGAFLDRLRRVDWVGTIIITGSTVAILYALAYGGTLKPWSDPAVIAGLTVGHAGLGLFIIWQAMPQCREPLMPLRFFTNRTSAAAFFLTFTNSLLIIWVVFIFPVYFQAVLGGSPQDSGIWLLPTVIFFPFGAGIAGSLMSKTGRYRPIHLVGFALCTLGFGLCSILDENSHKALWVILQLILALGLTAPIPCLLSAVQVQLSDADSASSTSTWSFIRSFGAIWGAAIPAAVFNDRFGQLLYLIDDPQLRRSLADGQAYAKVSVSDTLNDTIRDQVVHVYSLSLQRVWQIGIIFAGVSFLVVFLEKELVMRGDLETDFGLRPTEVPEEIKEPTR